MGIEHANLSKLNTSLSEARRKETRVGTRWLPHYKGVYAAVEDRNVLTRRQVIEVGMRLQIAAASDHVQSGAFEHRVGHEALDAAQLLEEGNEFLRA